MSHLEKSLNERLAKVYGCKPEEVDEVMQNMPCCYCGTLSHEGKGGIGLTEAEHNAKRDRSASRFKASIGK